MQVADITELASSATLGAGKAQRMSMAEDPALYLTMIISLYPNVKLAFIRETICNQWDAHIASGRTDTPIKITIDRDLMLTFRDYGNGIPIEKMDSTYNTLGGSTKRASTAETGGFGLGCRSRGEGAADGNAVIDHVPAGQEAVGPKRGRHCATNNRHDLNSGHKDLCANNVASLRSMLARK